jgi:hypothetical protein
MLPIDVESLAEALDLTCGVNESLRPRVERVAVRTDVDFQDRPCGPRLKAITTRTLHGRFHILRMDSLLHFNFLSSACLLDLVPQQTYLLDQSRRLSQH